MISALLAFASLVAPVASDNFRFDAYGDTRDGHDVHRKIVAQILASKPSFVIQTGDLVHRGSDESLWKIYDDITGGMRKALPVYPARGNHDLGGPGYEERVTAPFTNGNKLYYSFDKGASHFIALDQDEHSEYGPGSEQYKWMISDLEKVSKTAHHIVVFFHVPPYSIGNHGSDLDTRKVLCPVFEKYGVDLVINGHDHNFYETVRNGITYVVAGGGGAALYRCDPAKGAIDGDKWNSDVHSFIVFDVKGDTISAEVRDPDGKSLAIFEVQSRRAAVR